MAQSNNANWPYEDRNFPMIVAKPLIVIRVNIVCDHNKLPPLQN
jgi:hypothetical protein